MASISEIAASFEIEGQVVETRPLGNGLINDTFMILTDAAGCPGYVLQKINTAIFSDPEILQNNLLRITDHIRSVLKRQGVEDIDNKTLTPVRTKDGNLYLETEREVWRMTVYIRGSVTIDKVTPEMAYLTGEAFGEFHSYFSEADAPLLKETIPDFHNIEFRIGQLRESVAKDCMHRLEDVRDIVDELLSRSDEMCLAQRLHRDGKLPKRISHCDTKLNNILFDESGNILCVIDLDTTMPGFVLSDFGDFIRTAGNKGKEDDPALENVDVDMEVFKNFARGYVKSAGFLTGTEKRLLPFGAQMLTYMQTVRFLTDWLDGDRYYKISYPEHNLVRTKAQLKLLHSIDAHIDEMNDFIAKL